MNEIQIVSLMNLLIEWKAENMAIWEFMRANNTAPINWPGEDIAKCRADLESKPSIMAFRVHNNPDVSAILLELSTLKAY